MLSHMFPQSISAFLPSTQSRKASSILSCQKWFQTHILLSMESVFSSCFLWKTSLFPPSYSLAENWQNYFMFFFVCVCVKCLEICLQQWFLTGGAKLATSVAKRFLIYIYSQNILLIKLIYLRDSEISPILPIFSYHLTIWGAHIGEKRNCILIFIGSYLSYFSSQRLPRCSRKFTPWGACRRMLPSNCHAQGKWRTRYR